MRRAALTMNDTDFLEASAIAELGKWLDRIAAELRSKSTPYNRDCWPVCSFGWKHADLDDGCCGIKALDANGYEAVIAVVGGHVYFGIDEDWDEGTRDWVWEELCEAGYAMDADEDGWYLSFEERLTVPVKGEDAEADAGAILSRSKKIADGHTARWVELAKMVDEHTKAKG